MSWGCPRSIGSQKQMASSEEALLIFRSMPMGKHPCLQVYLVTLSVITKPKAGENAEMINLISIPRG